MDLLTTVEAYIEAHQLLEPGATVVVGVSGGPDSVALLDLLRRLAPTYPLHLHVAHLHHGIRGKEADRDLAWVAHLSDQWELPFRSEKADIPAIAQREGLSEEEAARQVRYGFLGRVAQETGASYIAVAHNADDQAETVLMHLIRGTGLAGLRGMLPKTRLQDYRFVVGGETMTVTADISLIRPLLSVDRQSIEAYVESRKLQTQFDHTNEDITYFRNKLRHEVIPYLTELNPGISERLCTLAEVVRADYALLEEFVGVAMDTLRVASYADAVVFDLERWRSQPLAVQRATIRNTALELHPSMRDLDFTHIENAVTVSNHGGTGAKATLPNGLEFEVGYDTLTLSEKDAHHLPKEWPWLKPGEIVPIQLPGVTPLRGPWVLHARYATHWNLDAIADNPNPLVAWIDADALGSEPKLRTRKKGDRFLPHGMGGESVRLSNFLINIKLRKSWRDHLPLLVNAQDQILWVVGQRLSEEALVSTRTDRVVYLRFTAPTE